LVVKFAVIQSIFDIKEFTLFDLVIINMNFPEGINVETFDVGHNFEIA